MTMTAYGEPITVENIPIVKRRSELKKQSRQLHQALKDSQKHLAVLERKAWETIEFKSNKSDSQGRKREVENYLASNTDHQEAEATTESLAAQVKELDDIISDVNFYQRERLVVAGNRYADAVDNLNITLKAMLESTNGMAQTVGDFDKAVTKFVASRSK